MLLRFSLYGFLKNQRYFEPFLILAFVEKGMSFFAIGALIGFREIATNVLEIPSGSIADLLGRRRSMLLAFGAYLCSFVVFWLADEQWILWPAMFLFAIGEAFRTGTHKSMIFEWLRREGRSDEKTKVYGHTRSWSKFGSAASVMIGAGLVFWLDSYAAVFLLSAVPTALNLVNLGSYPKYLDGEPAQTVGWREVWQHSRAAIACSVQKPALRRLMTESMSFEGVFHASKDYLQPLLAAAATAWFAVQLDADANTTSDWSELQRTTLLIAPVYLCLHLMSAFASRRAHRLVQAVGGDEARAARVLWSLTAALFVGLLIGELANVAAVSIAAFVLLHVVQNLWRPILISRIDQATDNANSAVTLSVESQARRMATIVLAPLFGFAIDTTSRGDAGQAGIYWPIAVVGCALAILMRLTGRRVATTA
ncbi:MAG: MFS family permease [Planctomycetota bacterium]